MNSILTIRSSDISQCLKCSLCNGFLVDATALPECAHEFCKSCIVQSVTCSLRGPVLCPKEGCVAEIHKTKPFTKLRNDTTLQTLVYKLYPEVYAEEMHRRRMYYEQNPDMQKFFESIRSISNEEIGIPQNLDWMPKIIPSECKVAATYDAVFGEHAALTDTLKKKGAEARKSPCIYFFRTSHTISTVQLLLKRKFQLAAHEMIFFLHNQIILDADLKLGDIIRFHGWSEGDFLHLNFVFLDHRKYPDHISQQAAIIRIMRRKPLQISTFSQSKPSLLTQHADNHEPAVEDVNPVSIPQVRPILEGTTNIETHFAEAAPSSVLDTVALKPTDSSESSRESNPPKVDENLESESRAPTKLKRLLKARKQRHRVSPTPASLDLTPEPAGQECSDDLKTENRFVVPKDYYSDKIAIQLKVAIPLYSPAAIRAYTNIDGSLSFSPTKREKLKASREKDKIPLERKLPSKENFSDDKTIRKRRKRLSATDMAPPSKTTAKNSFVSRAGFLKEFDEFEMVATLKSLQKSVLEGVITMKQMGDALRKDSHFWDTDKSPIPSQFSLDLKKDSIPALGVAVPKKRVRRPKLEKGDESSSRPSAHGAYLSEGIVQADCTSEKKTRKRRKRQKVEVKIWESIIWDHTYAKGSDQEPPARVGSSKSSQISESLSTREILENTLLESATEEKEFLSRNRKVQKCALIHKELLDLSLTIGASGRTLRPSSPLQSLISPSGSFSFLVQPLSGSSPVLPVTAHDACGSIPTDSIPVSRFLNTPDIPSSMISPAVPYVYPSDAHAAVASSSLSNSPVLGNTLAPKRTKKLKTPMVLGTSPRHIMPKPAVVNCGTDPDPSRLDTGLISTKGSGHKKRLFEKTKISTVAPSPVQLVEHQADCTLVKMTSEGFAQLLSGTGGDNGRKDGSATAS